jgi:hypothetical protein
MAMGTTGVSNWRDPGGVLDPLILFLHGVGSFAVDDPVKQDEGGNAFLIQPFGHV